MANFSNFYRNVRRNSRPQRKNTQTTETLGNRIMRSSGVGASVNPLTPTQKAEQERAQRMRRGISPASYVVRSQVGRNIMNAPRINKAVVTNNRLFGSLRGNALAPIKQTADYTKSQQSKYLNTDIQRKGMYTPATQLMAGKTNIGVEQGKTLRAGMMTNSPLIESWRPTSSAAEKVYRDRYGFNKEYQEALNRRLDNSSINEDVDARGTNRYDPHGDYAELSVPLPSGRAMPTAMTVQNGAGVYHVGDSFRDMKADDFRSGLADTLSSKNPEDVYRRQTGKELDEDTLQRLEQQRGTWGYNAGMMTGQMAQYALTRGALSGLGLVGKAAQAEKVAKAAGKVNKARGISFLSELGIDQAASLPLNILDAFKENSPQDIWNRFKMNQGLDALFSVFTTGFSISNNPAFKEAKALHESANELRASGDKAMADVTDMAAYKKVGEVPKEEIELAQEEIRKGYHAGDGGKSEFYRNQAGGLRDTGAYGTGTYFGGSLDIFKGTVYESRPMNEIVNLDNYNLYRPQNAEQGVRVHDNLRRINRNVEKVVDDVDTLNYGGIERINDAIERPFSKENLENIEDVAKRYLSKDEIDEIENKALNQFNRQHMSEEERVAERMALANDKEYVRDLKRTLQATGMDADDDIVIEAILDDLGVGTPEKTLDEIRYDWYSDALESSYRSGSRIPTKLEEASESVRAINELAQDLGINRDVVEDALRKTAETIRGYGGVDFNKKLDSASTVFMKNLGFEGVDVTGIKGLDNTRYGSVIYDLKPDDLRRISEGEQKEPVAEPTKGNNAIAETVAKEQPAAKSQESIAKGSAQERSAHFQKHLDNPNANRERGVARQRENALATMKDGEKRKGSFYINVGKVNGETTIGSVNGEYFKQNGIVFGVHKGSGKKKFWFVTDVETGMPVGTGKTKKEALSSIDESAIRNGADRQRAVNQFQKEIDNKVRIDDEQLRKVINSYEGMSDSELMAEKTKLLDTKSSAKEFEWQYDERINLIDDILDSRKKSESIAEEPKQLYNEPRGDGNGAEKHQGTVERAGSGEEEVRANVGAVQNGERQAVGGTHLENSSNPASTGRTGSTLSLTDEQRAVMDAAGKTNANLREADYSAFSNALNEGKASNKYGSYVDPQDVDELTKKGAKTFLSDDGSVGFAITKDGDMIGAFNRGGKYRGAVDDMLITARLNGGTKLDCYGIGLVNKYEQAGYVPVARIPFNPEYVNDPLLLANKPDVYVMMKNGDDIDTVIRKNANGEYHVSSPEELDALRTFDDYDAALKYRDDLLAKQENPKAETSVAKTNVAEVNQKANTAQKTETAVEQTAKKAEQAQDKTWQEHAREDYKTGKQRAKAVEEGKIPSRENGEVVNAIKRLKETKDFSNVKDALDRGVKDGIYNRKIRHLDEEIDKAIKEIEADPEKAINDVLDYHPNGAKANDVPADAIPWVMKGYALCKWADVNGMTALKEDIAATMAKAQSTGGSILRAGQVFTVMADTKTQRDIVEEYVKKMQEKYASRLGDHKLSVSEDLLNKLDNATTDAEKSKILDDITVHVWNQVPQSFIEAMGSFRIVSMLANTTTMIRNLASNAGFLGVREVDKSVNTMMEATAEKLNKIDRAHRTHTIYNPFSKENRKTQAYWYRDYGKHRNIIKGQSRWDEGGGTLSLDLRPQEGRHFGIKAGGGRKGGLIGVASAGLEGTRKATSWIMDTGDEAFLAPAYADAATQLMVVRGWKVEDLTPARVQEIRDYATLVAQQATYRDPSEFATALAKWGHWQKGDGALRLVRAVGVSGLQPFKKTPINVGKRAVEYSPIGFVKGVYDIRSAIKAGDSTAVNKAITELSKGTTGTGLVVAGYLLAEQGVINAQLPTDDEGYLRRDLGEQDYALNIGGKSRSLQWAAPGAIPILSGATLYDQVQQRGWNALLKPQTLVSVLSKSANPLLEMSFMQSYMDIAESTDDVKGVDKFFVGMEQIGLSYAAQYVPTMLGKIANLVDPVRRDTSSQSTDPYVKAYERFINKSVINKIPFKSKSLPAYRDAFGNIQTTEDVKDRIIQNFVSPWYTKEIKTDDPVFKELFRINNATPDTNLIPTNSIGKGKHELSLNGETINLDPHDMEEYKKIRGEGNQKALKFIDSDEYKSMSDTERAKALEDIYENAKVDAKRQMLLKKGKSEWEVYTEGFSGGKAEQIGAAKNAGIDPKDYNHTLTDKTADADGNGTVSKSEYYDYLLRQNQYNDKQRAVLMAAKNKSWEGKYNPFVTGEPPKDSQTAHAESTSYTDDIKSTGLSEKQFKEITSADTARIDSNGSGRVSQKEYQAYLDSFSYLTDEQKSALWKKYNPHWKKNPYDGSTASSGSSKRSRSGRRSSGGGSSKAKARAKTASEKRFAALQTGKAPTNAKGIEALSNGAKGLTKAQKKALIKMMQKKLDV